MKRLIEKIVFCGLVTAWRLATVPTRRSPDCVKATTEGVVRPPSAFSMTVGSPTSSTAMHDFVVARSIPIVFPILLLLVRKNLSLIVADLSRLPRGVSRNRPIIPVSRHALLTERVRARAQAAQRAPGAVRAPGMAGAPPVPEEVHVELELLARRRDLEHRVVELLERGAGAKQRQPRAHPRDVRVDRDVPHPEREQQHARRGLAPDARQRGQVGLR